MTRCWKNRGRNISVSCGHPDVFQETSFRSALRGEKFGHGEFLTNQGLHETFEESLTLYSRTRDMHLELIRPSEQLTEMVAGVTDHELIWTRKGGQPLVVS